MTDSFRKTGISVMIVHSEYMCLIVSVSNVCGTNMGWNASREVVRPVLDARSKIGSFTIGHVMNMR